MLGEASVGRRTTCHTPADDQPRPPARHALISRLLDETPTGAARRRLLGALLAGIVLRRRVGRSAAVLVSELGAIAYGFFIPVFFVYSGMSLGLVGVGVAEARRRD